MTNCEEEEQDRTYRTGRLLLEIERLQDMVAELLPFMINDIDQALSMGPPPSGHNDDCSDCVWYRESVALKKRLDAGEFDLTYPRG